MSQEDYDALREQLNKALDWFYENASQEEAIVLHRDIAKILVEIEILRVKVGDREPV